MSACGRTFLPVVVALAVSGCATTSSRNAPPPSTVRLPSPRAGEGKADATVERLRRDIDAILAAPAFDRSYWGVLIKSLKTDETLYALNARKLMMPASNMKIVTLAAAAEQLGWDYRFGTRLFAAGTVDGGTLQGDLIAVGSGDPSLVADGGMSDRVFAEWADRLRQHGIRAVSGRVIGDDNGFEEETLGFGWMWDDLPTDDSAGVAALQYNENAVRVTISPGPAAGDSAGISLSVGTSGLTIVNAVTTSGTVGAASLSTRRLPGTMKLELRGSIPAGAPPSTLLCSVDNPTQFFASALRAALIANGIDVRGPAIDIDEVPDAPKPSGTPIVSYQSAPLSTLAVRLMKVSQNQYAETLLKAVATAPDVVPTAAAGWIASQRIFERWGVPPGALIQRDGSGLTRYDFVTPEALVTILTHVARDARLNDLFRLSLPIAGRDGTLSNRMKGTAAEGNARAKTGSMTAVRGLSGYVTTGDGEPLVFSILANNYETPADVVNKATDAIVVGLATFAR